MMNIDHLKTDIILDSQTGIHFSRLNASSATGRMHDHDFAELFIINRGEIVHKINGKSKTVKKGQVVFIRPRDVHGFSDIGIKCELYNLAFRADLLDKCVDFSDRAISSSEYYALRMPSVLQLEENLLKQIDFDLEMAADLLMTAPGTARTMFYAVILKLYALRFAPGEQDEGTEIPSWLRELCDKMSNKENFIAGLSRMQKLACCSPEHLCRTCQKYLGKSPTEYINELRVKYAASQLLHSDEKVIAVAMNSGFPNLSHFYHQFKKIYNTSPAAFRKQQQKQII
jgi:AraC family transcriptional regulator, dual regulator of chb operon